MNKRIDLLNDDHMTVMARYGDKHFDLAIVDPEFGIGASEMKMGSGKKQKWAKGINWDSKPPSIDYFTELFRVSKNQIIWGGNYFTDMLPVSRGWIFWDKGINGETSFADGELAWTSFDTVLRKVNVRYKGFLGAEPNRIHPTQKPVKLYDWCFHEYLPDGGKVLDTHGGSMTIATAAYYRKNISLVCCEKVELYYNDAIKNYNLMTSQIKAEFPI